MHLFTVKLHCACIVFICPDLFTIIFKTASNFSFTRKAGFGVSFFCLQLILTVAVTGKTRRARVLRKQDP
jgi:hypothetical protein